MRAAWSGAAVTIYTIVRRIPGTGDMVWEFVGGTAGRPLVWYSRDDAQRFIDTAELPGCKIIYARFRLPEDKDGNQLSLLLHPDVDEVVDAVVATMGLKEKEDR